MLKSLLFGTGMVWVSATRATMVGWGGGGGAKRKGKCHKENTQYEAGAEVDGGFGRCDNVGKF